MNQLTLYKILTIILIPIAALFGFLSLIMIFIALANPVLLLPLFIIIGFTIYTIASSVFLFKGISNNQPCKPKLKDWIKVNGYVSIVMGVMTIFNTITLMSSKKSDLKPYAEQMLAMQPVKQPGMDAEALLRIMSAISYGMMTFAILLLIHLFISFRLLKKYQYLFSNPQ